MKSTPSDQSTLSRIKQQVETVRRAYQEFMTVPTLTILAFLVFAVGMYLLERSDLKLSFVWLTFFENRIFADASSTSQLLSTIAGSIITVTSITITLLLLIVQQTASSLTGQVFDQFLRRRSNQFYFGFFIGLALYTLITLATVNDPFNPVLSASLAFILTVVALFLLILLFYSTIYQMRPQVIIQSIYQHTRTARQRGQQLHARTRRQPATQRAFTREVRSTDSGFVTAIDLEMLSKGMERTPLVHETVLRVSIGTFVAYQDVLAEIWLEAAGDVQEVEDCILAAIDLEQSRDLSSDAAYGIEQLGIIAWSAASPAKGNLAPALHTLHRLTDLLSRWGSSEQAAESTEQVLPIVYNDDVILNLIDTFESLAIIAAQSQEHQVLAVIFDSVGRLLPRVHKEWRDLMLAMLRRSAALVDAYHLTSLLDQSLARLIDQLEGMGEAQLGELFAAKRAALQAR